ncbi:MAG: DNA-binding protein [Clostridia bacterium]|nr:DNA-binding protein [Clostridia bacterium]
MEKDLQICSLLDVYGSFLSPKQRELTEQYYNDDFSLSEIAENEGITRQGVLDQIKRAVSRLYAWEKSCGYAARFAALKKLAKQIDGDTTVQEKLVSLIEEL